MYKNGERMMAWIAKIAEVSDIPNADSICAYRVGGWWVVDKKNAYNVGDLCVYVSIDSWVPTELAPFLSKGNEPREYNGVKGERLRTVKLRGTTSQGLLLPRLVVLDKVGEIAEAQDVTELLGIQKWEAPVPAQLAGQVRGVFPAWGKKTDAERCQNLTSEIKRAYDEEVQFEITIKLDGTSMSAGVGPDGEFCVCSRNLSLKLDQIGNTYVDVAKMYDLETKMKGLGRPLMISGEIIGEGIQKNQEKIKGQDFYVFNIWDPIRGEYLSMAERKQIVTILGLKHTPVMHESVTLRELGLDTVEKILKFAEGPSLNAVSREGVVFKSVDGKFMFKAVSNAWLVKNE
jgi:hypothetical protein